MGIIFINIICQHGQWEQLQEIKDLNKQVI